MEKWVESKVDIISSSILEGLSKFGLNILDFALEIFKGTTLLFSVLCMYSLIFGSKKMAKHVPVMLGFYILALVVEKWAGLA